MDKRREDFEAWFKKKFTDLHDAVLCGDLVAKDYKKATWQSWQQAQKVAVPEGFVLVPREPTKEMYLAGTHELTQIDFRDIYDTDSIQVYKAMIEAGEKK